MDYWGYQILFPLASLVGVLATLLFTRLHADEDHLPTQRNQSLGNFWRLVRCDRRFFIYLVGFTFFGLGGLIGSPLYTIVQVDRLQLSYAQIALLNQIQTILWLSGIPFWGRQVDRQSGIRVVWISFGISTLVPLAYIWATSGWMLAPAFIAQGIVNAAMELGTINTVMQLAGPHKVAEYAAVQATVMGLRGLTAPMLGSALLRLGVPDTGIFALGSVLCVISWLVTRPIAVPKSVR